MCYPVVPSHSMNHGLGGVTCRIIDCPGILTLIFGLIHSGISMRNQIFSCFSMLWKDGYPYTTGETKIGTIESHGDGSDSRHNTGRQRADIILVLNKAQNGKLIPAQASKYFDMTNNAGNFSGGTDQNSITGTVAKGVINIFEIIEIEIE